MSCHHSNTNSHESEEEVSSTPHLEFGVAEAPSHSYAHDDEESAPKTSRKPRYSVPSDNSQHHHHHHHHHQVGQRTINGALASDGSSAPFDALVNPFHSQHPLHNGTHEPHERLLALNLLDDNPQPLDLLDDPDLAGQAMRLDKRPHVAATDTSSGGEGAQRGNSNPAVVQRDASPPQQLGTNANVTPDASGEKGVTPSRVLEFSLPNSEQKAPTLPHEDAQPSGEHQQEGAEETEPAQEELLQSERRRMEQDILRKCHQRRAERQRRHSELLAEKTRRQNASKQARVREAALLSQLQLAQEHVFNWKSRNASITGRSSRRPLAALRQLVDATNRRIDSSSAAAYDRCLAVVDDVCRLQSMHLQEQQQTQRLRQSTIPDLHYEAESLQHDVDNASAAVHRYEEHIAGIESENNLGREQFEALHQQLQQYVGTSDTDARGLGGGQLEAEIKRLKMRKEGLKNATSTNKQRIKTAYTTTAASMQQLKHGESQLLSLRAHRVEADAGSAYELILEAEENERREIVSQHLLTVHGAQITALLSQHGTTQHECDALHSQVRELEQSVAHYEDTALPQTKESIAVLEDEIIELTGAIGESALVLQQSADVDGTATPYSKVDRSASALDDADVSVAKNGEVEEDAPRGADAEGACGSPASPKSDDDGTVSTASGYMRQDSGYVADSFSVNEGSNLYTSPLKTPLAVREKEAYLDELRETVMELAGDLSARPEPGTLPQCNIIAQLEDQIMNLIAELARTREQMQSFQDFSAVELYHNYEEELDQLNKQLRTTRATNEMLSQDYQVRVIEKSERDMKRLMLQTEQRELMETIEQHRTRAHGIQERIDEIEEDHTHFEEEKEQFEKDYAEFCRSRVGMRVAAAGGPGPQLVEESGVVEVVLVQSSRGGTHEGGEGEGGATQRTLVMPRPHAARFLNATPTAAIAVSSLQQATRDERGDDSYATRALGGVPLQPAVLGRVVGRAFSLVGWVASWATRSLRRQKKTVQPLVIDTMPSATNIRDAPSSTPPPQGGSLPASQQQSSGSSGVENQQIPRNGEGSKSDQGAAGAASAEAIAIAIQDLKTPARN